MNRTELCSIGPHRRRALICAAAIASVILAVPGRAVAANAIITENQKGGTTAWQIGLPPYVNSNDTDQWIRGYASATSINKGETITFNITTNAYSWKTPGPVPYFIDVYRVGWYSGAGGRLMKHLGPFSGVQQPGGTSSKGVTSPGCPYDANTGMIACQWTGDGLGTGSYTLDTSLNPDGSTTPDWTSGIYLALLTTNQVQYSSGDPDHQSYIIFAIRDDSRASDILFQQAVATYQAYNNYPDDGQTGKSLYDGGSYGSLTNLETQRAVKVSFDRPYTYSDHTGAGDFLHWELYFVRWLERNGYDVTYSTDVDTHANGVLLVNHKSILSVGHSEYWSNEMRNAFEAARDSGTSVGFFGANAMYAQIRFEPSPVTGVPNRVVVAYKDASLDPINNPANTPYDPSLTTVPWRSSPVNRPEQPTVGVMYNDYFDAEAPAQAYVVQNSGSWVYAGTGFVNGTKVPGILGYELDSQFPAAPLPAAIAGTYMLLSNSPFTGANGSSFGNSSIYQALSGPGAWVFGAGTIDWSWGLDSYIPPTGIHTGGVPAPNAGIHQTTANFLNKTTGRLPNPTNLTTKVPKGGSYKVSLGWVNNATSPTGFNVERSTDGLSFAQIGTTTATVTSFADTTAVSSADYYYRVAAFDATGPSAYSNVAVIGPAPAAPTALGASAVSSSEIDLIWTNNANNATAILVEISSNNSTFTQIASLAGNAISYPSTGLNAGATYYYRVRAQNAFGTSVYSNTASAATLGPPAAPSKLTARAAKASQINLNWQDNSGNEDGFSIFRSMDGVHFALDNSVAKDVTTFADTGLTANTKYYYYVQASNTYGTSAPSNIASATTPKK